MELSAKYAYKIYKEKSFSAAAKALFISQPALSASISRLEKEIGFKIFDRTTNPINLTEKGRIYMDSLEEIQESEAVMNQRIRRLSDMSYGNLSIGGSCSVAYYLLSVLCSKYHKLYPDITLELDMGNVGPSSNLMEKIKNHTLDLMIGYSFAYSTQKQIRIPLFEERYVIAMHKDLKGADKLIDFAVTHDEILSESYDKEKEIEDLSIFKNIEFLTYGKDYHTTKKMDALFGNYTASNCIIKNVRHAGMHYNMMLSGMGALMTSDTIIKLSPVHSKEILFFVPKNEDARRTLYITRQADLSETNAMQNFISLAVEMCEDGFPFKNL